MKCAIEDALNGYMVQQERQENCFEQLMGRVESQLEELEDKLDEKRIIEQQLFKMQEKLEEITDMITGISEEILTEAEDFSDFDFSEEMQTVIDEI